MESDETGVAPTVERTGGVPNAPVGGLDPLPLDAHTLVYGPSAYRHNARGPNSEVGTQQRRRRRLRAAYAVGLVVLVAAVVAGFELRAQLGRTNGSLTSMRAELQQTVGQVATARRELANITDQSNTAGQTLQTEAAQLAADQKQLSDAEANVHAQGVSISDLVTCLSGVEKALNLISLGNQSAAATTLTGVASSCKSAQPSG